MPQLQSESQQLNRTVAKMTAQTRVYTSTDVTVIGLIAGMTGLIFVVVMAVSLCYSKNSQRRGMVRTNRRIKHETEGIYTYDNGVPQMAETSFIEVNDKVISRFSAGSFDCSSISSASGEYADPNCPGSWMSPSHLNPSPSNIALNYAMNVEQLRPSPSAPQTEDDVALKRNTVELALDQIEADLQRDLHDLDYAIYKPERLKQRLLEREEQNRQHAAANNTTLF
ncbi:uncharacterized protein LOC106179505 [Lingula anatina]|uniref:Uncharacterized protein LOC106179505 n=1 Tax=Lingula anatina TaxID=7574 RepID=A0A1S3K7L8_LINAN|nr:uncharacterized protein LOC106179505 [Lingula anatina]|eukprot:XP_013418618.1 uncharacterized protein LOC106179505 [Lingula anatina]